MSNDEFRINQIVRGTETITFNRNDWSGKTETVEVDREARVFKLMGATFKLVPIVPPGTFTDEERAELEALIGTGFKIVSADGSWPEGFPFGSVWVKRDAATVDGDAIDRDAKDPYVAAAQLLCNTI